MSWGGAIEIEARQQSYLEVHSTSPLGSRGGIWDTFLFDNSELLYLDGITEEITLYKNATAALKGGRIDYITLYRRPQDSCSVTVYCQADYQKNATGISGLWADGDSFEIQFINVGYPFPPTANYINVVEVFPEPSTIALLALGGILLRRQSCIRVRGLMESIRLM